MQRRTRHRHDRSRGHVIAGRIAQAGRGEYGRTLGEATSGDDLREQTAERMTDDGGLLLQAPDHLGKVVGHLPDCLVCEHLRVLVGLLDRLTVVRQRCQHPARQGTVRRRMPDDDPLERLSSKELHDLALRRARRHLDVAFFWRLMKVLPAAEAATGEIEESQADVQSLRAHIDDVTESGRGEVAEALRPFYIEYLKQRGVDDAK